VQRAVRNIDIAELWDSHSLNAGFIVVRPTQASRRLYSIIRHMTTVGGIDDQTALNRAVRTMKSESPSSLRVTVLDEHRFLSGVHYFELSGHVYPDREDDDCQPPSKCLLVVHNNWIVGKRAKIYRMREHLMWLYDGDDRYYSSETRNYLTLENPTPSENVSTDVTGAELAALKTALVVGYLLDRVVILPRFHCTRAHVQCPLNSIVHIETFEAVCAGRYRENSFLINPKVPDSVKRGLIHQPLSVASNQSSVEHVTGDEVLRVFRQLSAKMLDVGNLQRVKIDFGDRPVDSDYISQLESAFRRARYRQDH